MTTASGVCLCLQCVIVVLHWLYFVAIELCCHLLDFKLYAIVMCKQLPSPNTLDVTVIETKFVDVSHDLDLFQNRD